MRIPRIFLEIKSGGAAAAVHACHGVNCRRAVRGQARKTSVLIGLPAAIHGVVHKCLELRTKPRATRFTLIELLVVIGIIGLLAALMFPVFSKVRMSVKKSSCLNNLHQIGIAVNSYVNDYNGYLPFCKRVPDSLDDPFSVVNTVKTGSRDVFWCPADEQPKYDATTFFQKYGTSYEWNTWLNGRLIDKAKLSMGGIILKTPLMGDAMSFHGSLGRNYLYPGGNAQESLEELME
ncbi:MAG: type II secretion system protein [Victivallales bacterium]|nr:type II secretion system protein [Victivallales bacterium]